MTGIEIVRFAIFFIGMTVIVMLVSMGLGKLMDSDNMEVGAWLVSTFFLVMAIMYILYLKGWLV